MRQEKESPSSSVRIPHGLHAQQQQQACKQQLLAKVGLPYRPYYSKQRFLWLVGMCVFAWINYPDEAGTSCPQDRDASNVFFSLSVPSLEPCLSSSEQVYASAALAVPDSASQSSNSSQILLLPGAEINFSRRHRTPCMVILTPGSIKPRLVRPTQLHPSVVTVVNETDETQT